MNRESAIRLLKAEWPQRERDLVELFRDTGTLVTSPSTDASLLLGASKFGGAPDVDADFEWPERDGRNLSFLLQLRCEDILARVPTLPLPARGLISIFRDMEEEAWGHDEHDSTGTRIYFFSDAKSLKRRNIGAKGAMKTAAIEFQAGVDVPDPRDLHAASLNLADTEKRLLKDLQETVCGGEEQLHKLFGYPNIIQNPMEDDCSVPYYERNQEQGSAPGLEWVPAAEWRLWLQIDTDDALDLMWGDSGRLYFWILERDLAQARFERSCVLLQCY